MPHFASGRFSMSLPFCFVIFLAGCKVANCVLEEDAQRAGFSGSITWADYWAAQKPGSSGTFSSLYTQMSCCQRLSDDDGSWVGAKDCVCRRVVNYMTIHACAMSSACAAAARDIKNARKKITEFTNKPVTAACSKALDDAICSYHFWGCSDNFPEEVYNNVCLDVCTQLENACSQFGFDVTLSNFTRGMYFHRGCRGFNGTSAQDCTRPSLATQPVLHAAAAAAVALILLVM